MLRFLQYPTMTDADLRTLSECRYAAEDIQDDHFDYSRVVVRKPWGYEYLVFQNDDVAVWILYLREGARTSTHCHPNKSTALVVLHGQVTCHLLGEERIRQAGEGLFLGKGVFHSTRADSAGGAFVMEIETPVNKRDLVRYKDDYGRQGQGYEGRDQMTVNVANYNYITFLGQGAYYDTRKHFGSTMIEIRKGGVGGGRGPELVAGDFDLVGVLSGSLRAGVRTLRPGEMIGADELGENDSGVSVDGDVILISTRDHRTRLADSVVAHLKSRRITQYFFAPGASNAHLIDAAAREPEALYQPQVSDLAAAQAAVVYSKLSGSVCCCVLSGGAPTAEVVSAVAMAWTDSVPVLFLSAQNRLSTLGAHVTGGPRQCSSKELDASQVFDSLCKYSVQVREPLRVMEELDRALHHAQAGRHGPVLVDVPIDILGMNVDHRSYSSFSVPVHKPEPGLQSKVEQVLDLLARSTRPVILLGQGVRLAKAVKEAEVVIESLGVPVLLSRGGVDLLPDSHPLNFGRPGTYGHRGANFVVQNADLLLSVGCRLAMPLIGRNHRAFARAARKVVVDIDAGELLKPTVSPDLAIQADAGDFLRALNEALSKRPVKSPDAWRLRCEAWRSRWGMGNEPYPAKGQGMNPYAFLASLSTVLPESCVVLAEGGNCLDFAMQSLRLRSGQRLVSASGLETDGYAMAGATGAMAAAPWGRVVCLCESSGFLKGLGNLVDLAGRQLPVVLVVFVSITDTGTHHIQSQYFGGRHVERFSLGLAAAQTLRGLAALHSLPFLSVGGASELEGVLSAVAGATGPVLVEVVMPNDHENVPRMALSVSADGVWSSRPLEDMHPLIAREDLGREMLIPLHDQTLA